MGIKYDLVMSPTAIDWAISIYYLSYVRLNPTAVDLKEFQ